MDVAIIGGGIAGLGTAITLKRHGARVRVFERRPSVHSLGAGIVCWPNAAFVLSELGLLAEVKGLGGSLKAMRRISKEGVTLGSLDIERLSASMGYPSLSVLRRDLMNCLLKRAEELHIPIQYGTQAIAIEESPAGNQVRFSNGHTLTPDLIIGADGRMNSVTRTFVIGDNQPVFQGFVNWIGIFEAPSPSYESLEVLDYWGVGARFGIVPVSSTTAYWAGGIAMSQADAQTPGAHIEQLRRSFKSWPSPVIQIVTQATSSNTHRLPLFDHSPTTTWHKGNVLMIGDAAHAALPTSGQGAAQALEDAWFLGRALGESPGSLQDAIAAFTKSRLKKTAGIIMSGRAFAASLFNEDPAFCAARDHGATLTDYAAMATGMAAGWSAGLPMNVPSTP